MIKRIQSLAMMAAAGALLAVPAISQANKPVNGVHDHPTGKSCKTVKKGFVVKGTLVSYTAGTLVVTVTKANRHARVSGELVDSPPAGGPLTYTVPATDPFSIRLAQYEGVETPGAGDKVHIIGKVTVTKKKCAPTGTSVADRYGAVNVRKVKFTEVD